MIPTERNPIVTGSVLMVIAVFFFSGMDVIAKYLSQSHHPFQIVWARYTSQSLAVAIIFAPQLRRLLVTNHIGMQLLRSAFLFGGTMFFFFSISFMKLVDATAVFEVAPLMITVFAFFILREPVGPRRWTCVIIGLMGAMIIIRPGASVFQVASLLPAVAATCFAAYAIATRFLGQEESPWTSFLYTALIGTIVACIIVPFYWTMPTFQNALLMGSMGLIGGVGHYCLIRGFGMVEASLIAPFAYCSLVFNTLWGMVFFAELPDFYTILGAIIIVSAGLYIWYREMRASKIRAVQL